MRGVSASVELTACGSGVIGSVVEHQPQVSVDAIDVVLSALADAFETELTRVDDAHDDGHRGAVRDEVLNAAFNEQLDAFGAGLGALGNVLASIACNFAELRFLSAVRVEGTEGLDPAIPDVVHGDGGALGDGFDVLDALSRRVVALLREGVGREQRNERDEDRAERTTGRDDGHGCGPFSLGVRNDPDDADGDRTHDTGWSHKPSSVRCATSAQRDGAGKIAHTGNKLVRDAG